MQGISEPKPTEKWGFTSKTKYALVELAPLTASGLNEVIATGRTKKEVTLFAAAMGISLRSKNHYVIITAADIRGK